MILGTSYCPTYCTVQPTSNVQCTVQLGLFHTSAGYVLNVLRRVLEVHEGPNIGLIGHSSLLSSVHVH